MVAGGGRVIPRTLKSVDAGYLIHGRGAQSMSVLKTYLLGPSSVAKFLV